jgi:hypothetical protein
VSILEFGDVGVDGDLVDAEQASDSGHGFFARGAAVQDCPYLNLPGKASWPVIAASDIIT